METKNLKAEWEKIQLSQPKIRIRNAAEQLGVSEVELLVTRIGENAIRLKPSFKEILSKIQSLGKVMALSRNNEVVHERKGVYLNPNLSNSHVGLFVNEDIDLRIFFHTWSSAFAVTDMVGKDKLTPRQSIQFFAKNGEAIHKIYLTPHSDKEAYDQLVEEFVHEDQSTQEQIYFPTPKAAEIPDSEVNVEKFQEGWINLKDTHDFFGLVKGHKLSRTQALRLAPQGNYANQISNNALRQIISLASERQIPIMVFVGNQGMIQIHTGTIKKLLDYGEWFNVMDPDFNLHVKENSITQSWIVRKPTTDGMVTALECFNKKGEQIVQLFGKRKPGIPELESWRELVKEVEDNLISN